MTNNIETAIGLIPCAYAGGYKNFEQTQQALVSEVAEREQEAYRQGYIARGVAELKATNGGVQYE